MVDLNPAHAATGTGETLLLHTSAKRSYRTLDDHTFETSRELATGAEKM
jgi:hypothetical protein